MVLLVKQIMLENVMFFNEKIFFNNYFNTFLITKAFAEIKENIIKNTKEYQNISFNFEQNINGSY